MTQNFADRLLEEIERKKAPCVVGLDTALEALPPDYLKGLDVQLSSPRRLLADAVVRFNRMVIDTIADLVPAVKPNAAFYERYGSDGVRALEETVAYAKSKGLLVILDAKRGDIGNTAEAYARAYLKTEVADDYAGQSADALTISPYLGSDTLEPFVKECMASGTGVFVLVRTSNKGAGTLQDLKVDGTKIYEKVADIVSELGKPLIGKRGYSSFGAVVGATWPEDAKVLRTRMKQTLFLVPGFGAQGGDLDTVRACFDKDGLGAIVNSSRGILYPAGSNSSNYRELIGTSCEKFVNDLRSALGW